MTNYFLSVPHKMLNQTIKHTMPSFNLSNFQTCVEYIENQNKVLGVTKEITVNLNIEQFSQNLST